MFVLSIRDLDNISHPLDEEHGPATAAEEAGHPFALEGGPLVRAVLFRHGQRIRF